MQMSTETILDFDRTVGDEDRFQIRKVISLFVQAANSGNVELLEGMISDSTVIEGFSDIPYMKQEFASVVSRWPAKSRIMRFPKLKLTYNRYLFHLIGTYEEFMDGIIVTEGTIELALIKTEFSEPERKFKFVRMHFYPRMRLSEKYNE